MGQDGTANRKDVAATRLRLFGYFTYLWRIGDDIFGFYFRMAMLIGESAIRFGIMLDEIGVAL